jgi:hypothetical protein
LRFDCNAALALADPEQLAAQRFRHRRRACRTGRTADMALHDTYIVWNWELGFIALLVVVALILGIAALIKYLLFR